MLRKFSGTPMATSAVRGAMLTQMMTAKFGRGGPGQGQGGHGDRARQEAMLREQEMMQRQMQQQQRGGGGQPPRDMMQQRGGAPPQRGGQMQQQQQQQMQMEDDEMDQQQQAPPEPPKKPENPPQFLKIDTVDGVTTFSMNRAPVNSLNLELMEEMTEWLMWHSYTDETKAVILTSSINMVFSAGLDITELHKPKEDRFPEFWTVFQEVWLILNTFPKPVVAAINGNSPAGGCVLALCCDTRVMARCPEGKPEKPYRIGLNETKLGIVAPPWVMQSMKYVVGSRKAERMLQLGETPTADEALNVGLVDVVVDESKVAEAAKAEVKKLLSVSNEARWMTKDMLRKEVVEVLADGEQREYDTQFFTQLIQNAEVQKSIDNYLARLRKK